MHPGRSVKYSRRCVDFCQRIGESEYVAMQVSLPQTEKSPTTTAQSNLVITIHTGCNDNMLKAILYRGIDSYLEQITITSGFRLSFRLEKLLIVLLGNRYNQSYVAR